MFPDCPKQEAGFYNRTSFNMFKQFLVRPAFPSLSCFHSHASLLNPELQNQDWWGANSIVQGQNKRRFLNAKESEQGFSTLMLISCLLQFVCLFVFIFYCQQGTRFYRQLNREQMLIKRDVVLSVTLKKYHPLFSKCCSPNGLNFLLTHI